MISMSKKSKTFLFLALSIMAFIFLFIFSSDTEFTLSKASGFYDQPFYLELKVPLGAKAYYTLDGSRPSSSSTPYEGPVYIEDASTNPNVYSMRTDTSVLLGDDFDIDFDSTIFPRPSAPSVAIDKCTVFRAVCINSLGQTIGELNASYFVDFNNKPGYENMNIVSIITDPENLFDYETGILVTGKAYDEGPKDNWNTTNANYKQKGLDWEKEAYVEFYNSSRKTQLTKKCGLRIQGNYSRSLVSKSFRLYARDIYDGDNHFEYDFFDNSYMPKTVTLFSGSQDCLSLMRDCMIQDLSRDNLNLATMHYAPYVLFLDGEYWGIHYLCETYEDEYFEHYYGVDENNVVVIKDGLDVGDPEKDESKVSELAEYAFKYNDYTNNSAYNDISKAFDLSNVADYFALEIYIGRCHDWPTGNISTWATRDKSDKFYADRRWRYVLFDLYYNSMSESAAEIDTYDFVLNYSPLMYSLTRTEAFRNQLADSIDNISNNILSNEAVDSYIDDYIAQMSEPMTKQYQRFYGDSLTDEDFTNEVEEIRSFLHERHAYADDLVLQLRNGVEDKELPDYSMFDVLFE